LRHFEGLQAKKSEILKSGDELLEIQLLGNQLVNSFGRKSTAQHEIFQLLE
jgi:hypothetical protein